MMRLRKFKKSILSVSILFLITGLEAQIPDLPDYRSKKDNFSKVREKDIRGDLATFTLAGIDEMIGKEPLQKIEPTEYTGQRMRIEGNEISVLVETTAFDKSAHKLMFYDEKYLLKINNKPFYGSYATIPQRTISKVVVVIKGDTIAIPPVAYQDLHNPSFYYRDGSGVNRSLNGVFMSADGRKIYIYLLNRLSNNQSYEVTWVLVDNQFFRRVLDFDLPG